MWKIVVGDFVTLMGNHPVPSSSQLVPCSFGTVSFSSMILHPGNPEIKVYVDNQMDYFVP